MRYNEAENTVLAGMFETGGSVTIKVIDMIDDSLETLTSDICTESANISGCYLWDMTNITQSGYKNFLYEMTDGTKKFYGKFVYGDNEVLKDKIDEVIATLAEGSGGDEVSIEEIENAFAGIKIII